MGYEILSATFIGEDGSMGFNKGDTYLLKLEIVNHLLVVRDLADKKNFCPYHDMDSLLSNWEVS